MKKILCVDDNQDYLSFLKEVLTIEGYQVEIAADATTGLSLFKEIPFDLVISDLKMESIDGLKFLYLLRKINENIKVILLTSSENEADEIQGLELNVNDYIQKEVSIKVLLKRIEYTLRQNWVSETNILQSISEGIRVDLNARRVFKDDSEVQLTFKEYEMTVLFLKNRNMVFTREEIITKVWGEYQDYFDVRVVDTHVKRIRAKLKTSRILTIRGVGYEWVE